MDVCLWCGDPCHTRCDGTGAPPVSTVDVRALEDLEAGDEALNSYGDLGNAELLLQYGFALPYKTGWERCHWDPAWPPDAEALVHALGLAPDTVWGPCEMLQPPWVDAGEAAQDRHGSSAAALAFAPCSLAHDREVPFFVDAEGRASWPLWRLCIGVALLRDSHPDVVPAAHHAAAQWEAAPTTSAPIARARGMIADLCARRLEQLRVAHDEDAALDLLSCQEPPDPPPAPPLRSVLYHAFQDADLLRAGLARYARPPAASST